MPRGTRTALVAVMLAAAGVTGTTLLTPDVAVAADKGRPVTIRVVDQNGVAIPNANVRVPGTEGKTKVNGNGEWTETMLYTIEGDEFVFKKNETIVFYISAPEFHARTIAYPVKGRMNYVEIALRKMPEPTKPLEQVDDQDLLIRWFQRTEVEDSPDATSTVSTQDAPAEETKPEGEGG